MARFIPKLLACQGWKMEAVIRTPRKGKHVRLNLSPDDGLQTYLDPPDDFDSGVEEAQADIKPLLIKIENILLDRKATTPPKSLLGQAISYALGQWPRIVAYVESPGLTPDNNAAENAIRPFTVGRKNWLFAGSPKGAKASAAIYSLIESAKANGLNPHQYLLYMFEKLPHASSKLDLRQTPAYPHRR